MTVRSSYPFLAIVLLFPIIACEPSKKPSAMAPPPPKVTAARPIVRDVVDWDEYTGRLAAVEMVDVKAQVSGFVETTNFVEGSLVHKGDVLLTIDPRNFQAELDSAQASVLEARAKLQLAKATLELAQNDLHRGEQASKNGGISAEELDTRSATVDQDQANVDASQASIAAAEAAVKAASLNVEWCKVTAPITGRISDKRITPGNMLTGGPGSTTTITTITSVDPIYCYVDADEAAVLKYQKLAREEKRVSAVDNKLPCYMELLNETGFPHAGTIDFLDNRIDPTTGTRRARGVFPNPDGSLIPGFFARFRVTGQEFHDAVLVLDDAIGIDQDRKFVFLLHPDKTLERRTVTVGPLNGQLRVILAGVAPTDVVLINGMANIAQLPPGAPVDPAIIPMPESNLSLGSPPTASTSASQPAASAPATGGRAP